MKLSTVRLAGGALGAALLTLAPLSAQAQGSSITVQVIGVRYAEGVVRVDVCTRDTFLKRTCPYSGEAPAQVGTVNVVVPSVPMGTYAIQAYHDANNNDDVDQGFLGMPKEDLGFSNDVPVRFHAPSFNHAAFTHGDTPQTLQLHLHHFRGK